ncbi:ATP-binding protein [Natronobiforma cellulositropha]|uniref:ATP-binding protein n=1 Tax=Natronobiforma cellulositropha TaxID=1679076 RepID=UPI0021D5B5F6|nr:ATP-binding protein [Natronobiforma cellulositropha]
MDDYWRDFVQESEEHITELNNSLLVLERSPTDTDALTSIFRSAHTLKGNCGAMGLTRASDLAHAIEDLLDAVRSDEVEVTPALMDTIFQGVDALERAIDEAGAHGEVRTDPSETIEALRAPLEGTDQTPGISRPSDDELESTLAGFEPPADDDHDTFFVRLLIDETEGVNNGRLVVDALIDAFDLLGTVPSRETIDNDAYGHTFDAVFGSAVDETAIAAALEPVDAVDAFEIVTVTDRVERLQREREAVDDAPDDGASETLSSDDAQELSVEELLDEFTEFDDLDAMVEEVGDVSAFDDMGEAGSFHDLLEGTDDDMSGSEAPVDEVTTDEEPVSSDEPAGDDDDVVDDASAVFAELKAEVEMVGFDELQAELDELEFDEFDSDDEVDMDELLGDDVDVNDNSFLDVVSEADTGDAALETDDHDGGQPDDEPAGEETDLTVEETDVDEPAEPLETDETVSDEAFEALAVDEAEAADADAEVADAAADEQALEDLSALDGVDFGDGDEPDEPPTDDEVASDEVPAVDDEFGEVAIDETSFAPDPVDEEAFDDSLEIDDADAFAYEDDGFGDGEFDDDEFGDDGFDDGADTFAYEDDEFDDQAFDEYDFQDDETIAAAADLEWESSASEELEGFDEESAASDEETDESDDGLESEHELVIPDITVPEVPARDEPEQQADRIQSVRVDVEQIDTLLNLVEGLVTSRVRLRHAIEQGDDLSTIDAELDGLEDITSELQETVMDVRLVPLQTVANRLPRVVRDIARTQEKEVAFELVGEDVELDRSILDRIGDPLVHLVRNAVDHGIESPAEREALEKPREGSVELRASRDRDRVTIEVEDDGRGLDPEQLRSAAVEADILTENEVAELDDDEALELVFHPGLSTATEVTDVSGRGVGMDVVKRTVDELDGTVTVESTPDGGTTVTMRLPVTVAIANVLFVECGGEEFGIPTKVVHDIEDAHRVETVDGRAVLVSTADETDDEESDADDEELDVNDEREDVPVIDLAAALETPGPSPNGDGMVVRIRDEIRPVGLHCNEVRGQQEVVIKPFEGFMSNVPGLSGATVRGRGEVVNILDVNTL